MSGKRLRQIVVLLLGVGFGMAIGAAAGSVVLKKLQVRASQPQRPAGAVELIKPDGKVLVENFDTPMTAEDDKTFGPHGALTFELYRDGTFIVDPVTGVAQQRSESYRDSAWIRSTRPLPETYRVRVRIGEVKYDLDNIRDLPPDPEYPEGPANENGCYWLVITDQPPTGHHTNIWWHQTRKIIIDVDNNVWGHGMPNPIFMGYMTRDNSLRTWPMGDEGWQKSWVNAARYAPDAWYEAEIEKTATQYHLRLFDKDGYLLREASVERSEVWHDDPFHQDYFVIGDPHENYYQGSFKIDTIWLEI